MARDARDHDAQELTAIQAELQRLTIEGQSDYAVFIGILSVGLLTAGGYLALASRSNVPDWIWVADVIVPLLLLAYFTTIFTQYVVRTYYARDLERRHCELLRPILRDGQLPPGVSETVSASLLSGRRGLKEIRIIYFVEGNCVLGILVAACIGAVGHIGSMAAQIAVAGIALFILIPTVRLAWRAFAAAGNLWSETREKTISDLRSEFPHRRVKPEDRRLISYLLLPRPNDLVIKAFGLHLAAGLVGIWLAQPALSIREGLPYIVVSVLAFEFLLYQGRYMINDYLGRNEDWANRQARNRSRLPVLDSSTRVVAFVAVLLIRALGAFTVPLLLLPSSLARITIAALVAVLLVAIPYEWLRTHVRAGNELRTSASCFALWVLVGASYAIRVALGVYLGSDGLVSMTLVTCLALAFYFSGVSTVLMVWTLEVNTLVRRRQGEIPASAYDFEGLGTKDHLLPLAHLAGILSREAQPLLRDADHEGVIAVADSAILLNARRARQPWNTAILAAGAFAATSGWLGHEGVVGVAMWPGVAVGVVGALLAWLGMRQARVAWLLIALAAAASVTAAVVTREPHELFLALPFTAVLGTAETTRGLTYAKTQSIGADLKILPAKLVDGMMKVAREILR